MALSAEEICRVAELARLQLTEAELAMLTSQLGAIIDYVGKLQELSTDAIEPLAHPLPIQNVFREDEPAPSLPVDQALANAPGRRGDFYTVPAVLD